MKKRIQTLSRDARQAGFSIAELMVVILIIGLLSTVVVPKLLERLGDAKQGTVKADLNSMEQALTQYYINNNRYPDSLEGLVTPDAKGKTYLNTKKVPKDPWGNEYFFAPPQGTGEMELLTYGRDGAPGGEGEDRDLTLQMLRDGDF